MIPLVADFDIGVLGEAYRLLALLQHCPACEVEWHGGGSCWSCREPGLLGPLPALTSIKAERPAERV